MIEIVVIALVILAIIVNIFAHFYKRGSNGYQGKDGEGNG
ncbi:hypothetical protein LCGC14_1524610 [marine sediment metagenome]|uniref:Uncharacterized protein n=1 Tax=marine sediment metagenome TaxID=412755 RepID=A0A0F9JIG1_9ZZZZ